MNTTEKLEKELRTQIDTLDKTREFEEELKTYIHDLFLNLEYKAWRMNLENYEAGKWHSLIAKLHKIGAPVERLEEFGESIFSKLVFNYVKAPDYRKSKMLMVQFTVSESMFHSVVWHRPGIN